MIEHTRLGITCFQFHSLSGEAGLVHAISSRHGGVSPPPYDTLNLSLSVRDEPERVRTNRQRLANALGLEDQAVTAARQVHGAEVWAVEEANGSAEAAPPEADILITNRPGRFLSQRFADCVPVVLWDPVRRAVALAHAGWRGTALGVAGVAVRALTERYGTSPPELLAAIGPSIGPCCYEVGPEVVAHFAEATGCYQPTWEGRAHLDLWALNRRALVAAGVRGERIETADCCTRCRSDVFFSHRAAGGGPAGRFGALIGILP